MAGEEKASRNGVEEYKLWEVILFYKNGGLDFWRIVLYLVIWGVTIKYATPNNISSLLVSYLLLTASLCMEFYPFCDSLDDEKKGIYYNKSRGIIYYYILTVLVVIMLSCFFLAIKYQDYSIYSLDYNKEYHNIFCTFGVIHGLIWTLFLIPCLINTIYIRSKKQTVSDSATEEKKQLSTPVPDRDMKGLDNLDKFATTGKMGTIPERGGGNP